MVVFAVGAAGLAVALGFALAGLPGFGAHLGPFAERIANHAVSQRVATNSVIAVAFDYRALDTLAEEFMIFVAAIGATILLRTQREESEGEAADAEDDEEAIRASDALRALARTLAPIVVLIGLYVVSHGHLTPGGGFQGGVVLASAVVLLYAGGRYAVARTVSPVPLLEAGEAAGAAGFALVGVGGLVFTVAFFQNFIGLGSEGNLLSGGTIPVSNLAVGVEVAGAFSLVLSELLEQMAVTR
jgi:multicomponent Na+:H+ antiporter subunit B